MADDFWSSLLNNPQLVSAGIAGLGTLIDPAQAQTRTTQEQTSLPSYIAPYAQRMLQRGEALSQEEYTPYGGQRLAEFTPAQQQAFQQYMGMQVPGSIGAGGSIAQQAAQRLLGTQYTPGQFQPGTVSGTYQAGQFAPSSVTAPAWSGSAARQYMSPYQQGVTDIAKREAVRDYEANILPGIAGAATQRGAFGGSRQAILESEAGRNLGQRLSDIQTQGLQGAYTTGMQQFTADQQRALQAQLAMQQAGMSAQQLREQSRQYGAGLGYQAQLANQQARLQAQQLGEQSRQYGAGLGLQGLQGAAGAAATGANIGQQQLSAQNLINQNLLGIGALQQQQQQRGLDIGYQDFLRQQQQPYQQAQLMQSFLQGLPMTQYATAQTTPAPSMAQQLTGNMLGGYYGIGSLGQP